MEEINDSPTDVKCYYVDQEQPHIKSVIRTTYLSFVPDLARCIPGIVNHRGV